MTLLECAFPAFVKVKKSGPETLSHGGLTQKTPVTADNIGGYS